MTTAITLRPYGWHHGREQLLDDTDARILAERIAALDERIGPRVGDYIEFADGVVRRISHHWRDDAGWDGGLQTSDGGSFYLGAGYCNFSGSLHPCVNAATLTLTRKRRPGRVWFFHHDCAEAHNGVETTIDFRVYHCSENAPR